MEYPLGAPADDVRRATRALSIEGSTNMAHGLQVAWDALKHADGGRRVLVVLTDGAPDNRQGALNERRSIVRGDGEIIARGVQGADDAFLRELDSGSELLGAGELETSFRGIAKQLAGAGGGYAGLGRRR